MLVHDRNNTLGVALVQSSAEGKPEYVTLTPEIASAELEPVPAAWAYLRQRHYVANAIVQGVVIIGTRIVITPDDWERRAGQYMLGKALVQ